MNTELTTAFTDLMIALLCLTEGFIIMKRQTEHLRHRQLWGYLFFTTALAAFIGYLNHRIAWGDTAEGLIWLLLFPAMFEATRTVFLLALDARFGPERPGKQEGRIVLAAEILLCLPAMATRFFLGSGSMIFYALFAAVVAVVSLIHFAALAFRGTREAQLLFCALLTTAPAIFLQFTKKGFWHIIWDFDHNGIGHLFLFVALLLALWGALDSLKISDTAPAAA